MCCGSKSRLGGFVSRVRRSPGRRVLMNAAALLVAAVFTAPIAVLALGSLRRPGRPPPDGLELLPEQATTGNYATAMRMGDLAGQFANSLLIIAVAVPVTVLVASWAGFAIATARRRARAILLSVTVAALMVPPVALWVSRVVFLEWLGLTDHTLVVALPAIAATSPFYVLVFAFAYSRVPRTLFEAATLEGLSAVRCWLLTFPPARPAAFAVAMLATLPPVLVFLLAQRAFLTRTVEV